METVSREFNIDLRLRLDEDYLTLSAFRVALERIVAGYVNADSEPFSAGDAAQIAVIALRAFPERDSTNKEREASNERWRIDRGE